MLNAYGVVRRPLVGFGVVLMALCAWPKEAVAELYSWTDRAGVMHFTNLAPGDRAGIFPDSKKKNTFNWTDELGAMRRVHRLEVSTYDAIIIEAANYYSLPPALVKAVIATESAFEPLAVSKAGAQGLTQLMPKTAQSLRVYDTFDPRANIFGGARYLRLMANTFSGDIRLTAAAYNAGPKAVERFHGVPDFEETQTYVKRVLKLYYYYMQHWDVSP